MSVILKGVDLPTDGKTLIVGIYGNGLVSMEYTKPLALAIEINAEAIQIPKGHGRLIDGDWAKYNLENYSDLPTKYLHMDLVREAIEDAPTILEAEAEI